MKCFASVRPEEQCKCKVKENEQKHISAKKGQQKGEKAKQRLNLKCGPQDERFLLLMEK